MNSSELVGGYYNDYLQEANNSAGYPVGSRAVANCDGAFGKSVRPCLYLGMHGGGATLFCCLP